MKYYLILVFSFITLCSFGQKDADKSLSVKEYEAYGMPNPAVKWSVKDLDKALVGLAALKQAQQLAMPRVNSTRSGVCFQRLLATCRMEQVSEIAGDEKNKIPVIREIMGNSERLLQLYVNPQSNMPYYSTEITELYILFLANNQYQYTFLKGYVTAHPQMGGLQKSQLDQINYGYLQLLGKIINEMERTDTYKTADLEHLSAAVKVNVASNAKALDPASRNKLTTLFTRVAGSNIPAIEKKNIRETLALLK